MIEIQHELRQIAGAIDPLPANITELINEAIVGDTVCAMELLGMLLPGWGLDYTVDQPAGSFVARLYSLEGMTIDGSGSTFALAVARAIILAKASSQPM
ncbi:hypothetical protein ACVCNR_15015 [Aquamicrobium terrae]